MNLREETIKVLRPFADEAAEIAEAEEACGVRSPDDMSVDDASIAGTNLQMKHLRALASLLSRLEAGSGEETGVRLDEAARETLEKAIDCLDLEGFEETANSLHALINRADQEGGDAAVTDRTTAAPGDRSEGLHVATPAPGENSGRADVAHWMIANGFATGHGDTTADLLSELSWQITERVDKARRYGLEEAAKEIERSAKVLRPDELALVVRNLVPSVQS